MSKKMFVVPLLIAGLTIGGVAGAMVTSVFAATPNTSQSSSWGNMMGGAGSSFMNSVVNRVFSNVPKISSAAATKVVQTAMKQVNASIGKANNSITYTGQNVTIVALAGPTGADQKFVIDGLVNPTLHVPKGSKVTFQLINEDKGMPHGVEITSAKPPFAYMSMMQGGLYGGSFIHPIPAASSAGDPTLTTTFTADQAGTFTYLCQYPGHAQQGMYGQIVIS